VAVYLAGQRFEARDTIVANQRQFLGDPGIAFHERGFVASIALQDMETLAAVAEVVGSGLATRILLGQKLCARGYLGFYTDLLRITKSIRFEWGLTCGWPFFSSSANY
jgi:hypothetical protein